MQKRQALYMLRGLTGNDIHQGNEYNIAFDDPARMAAAYMRFNTGSPFMGFLAQEGTHCPVNQSDNDPPKGIA